MQLSNTLNTVMESFTLVFGIRRCIDFMKTDHAELMYVSYNLQHMGN
jgi:ribosomal protein L30E